MLTPALMTCCVFTLCVVLLRRLLAVSLITMLVGRDVVRIESAHLAGFNKKLSSLFDMCILSDGTRDRVFSCVMDAVEVRAPQIFLVEE